MGDSYHDPLRVDFDRQIKLEFHGSTVTSDAGLLPYRELDEALGLTRTVASGLHDTRTGQNTQHRLLASPCCGSRSTAGYEDVTTPSVRGAPGVRGLNEGKASCAVGRCRDGAGAGNAVLGENPCNRTFGV